jgi:hypothetical protein
MKLNYLCIVLLLGLCILFGCNKNSDDSSNIPITQVTFVDKGAVVPDPISTTVIIKSDSIEYLSTQSGNIINQWSKQIQSSEFNSVQQLIDNYNLFYSDDITLGNGQSPCEGWQGMTITMDGTDSSHTINIMGDVCAREQWSEGVHALFDLKDELVTKYQ